MSGFCTLDSPWRSTAQWDAGSHEPDDPFLTIAMATSLELLPTGAGGAGTDGGPSESINSGGQTLGVSLKLATLESRDELPP